MLATCKPHLAMLAGLSLLMPQTLAMAAEPGPASAAQTAPTSIDVVTSPEGFFWGRVVDPQGIGLAGQRLGLMQGSRQVAMLTTDGQGYFAVKASTGVYGMVLGGQAYVCRVWSPGAAPPAARQAVLLVIGQRTVRGQGLYERMAQRPFLTYACIAAVITVPIAVLGNDKDDEPASR